MDKINNNSMAIDSESLDIVRHSTAHVLAMAIKTTIDPMVQLAIGPTIKDGFYYDIKSSKTFTKEDFSLIEKRMKEIIKQAIPFEMFKLKSDKAIELFSGMGEEFKVELIKDLDVDSVTIYKLGEFIDLCRGPHVPDTSHIPLDAFKLINVAGAYWRGDSTRDMLQRIYGTAWFTKSDMENYFQIIEEAEARDHRKLGPVLDIFHIDEEAVGSIFWLKNGTILFNTVKNYISRVIKKYGYFQVQTPQILNKSLWETSGHWEKFRESMFIVQDDDKTMAIKPMNCPGHVIVYKTGSVKSYRDLPCRIAEFGLCHRNEPSGSLHGLMRVRAFTQDDGHVFCSQDQIISETQNICATLKEIYSHFGFNEILVKFSNRPEKRVGSDEVWDIAEKSLMEAADISGLAYTINEGEGAFYGPKLEFVLKDSLGRDWQCGTLQVDFVLPERFDIHYIDKNGEKQRPVMIHRALVGSLERFIGILIEHYAGKFPFWLAPVQIAVASVTDRSNEYASEIYEKLENIGYRCVLDTENEKITYKIRQHSTMKVPVIIVIGQKEQDDNTVSIRKMDSKETEVISVSDMQRYFEELSK
ncbi:MAG: threonine--tRNA ligase [Holosporales bacterium]|jgi:threonyl-tRNA synthetase|nr:threonine--tRNA ligase [Holosporales bacterium]